ncbi:snaclec coagulation factor IX/factor X-binding protein subunit A isoform X2 [Anabrus simplex]|uniref:snaclec coagulation factor IX/factor X-binding protein subunit A isoform X2 n=1 Tax=Anabrus simplex TaxID=316456 RepID=UPI0035A2B973
MSRAVLFPHKLRKAELTYELAIRGASPAGSVADCANLLSELIQVPINPSRVRPSNVGTSTNTTPVLDTTSKPITTTPATTTPTTSATTTTTPTTSTTTKPKSCRHSGYQLFEGFNCYKGYEEWKTWSNAREQCKGDGGDLMVMDSEREIIEVYPAMYQSVGFLPWIGVYKLEGLHDRWVSVKGEPALSSWWLPGYPDNRAGDKCARAEETGLLWNFKCADLRPFICEIPL